MDQVQESTLTWTEIGLYVKVRNLTSTLKGQAKGID